MEIVHCLNFLKYFVMKVFCFVVFLHSLGSLSKILHTDILFVASFSRIQNFQW